MIYVMVLVVALVNISVAGVMHARISLAMK